MENSYSGYRIFRMSIPIFVELLLQMLVGNIDQIMISQYSQNSVAAIGNGNQIMNIVIIVVNVMSISTTILISQYLGADNKNKVAEVCNVSIFLISIISILITLFLLLFNRYIFMWLKVPNDVIDEACSYTSIVGSFILIQGLYMTFAAILRSSQFMKEIMFVSIIMNVINIIGNAILINGLFIFPRLGIIGAAVSTNISKCIGLALVILMFLKHIKVKLSLKYLKPFPKSTLKNLLYIGLPSGGEQLSYNLTQICILKFVNIFGTVVIATKVYCSMLANVAYVYSIAISQATQIIVSYLIGAGKINKINKHVWSTIVISMSVSLTITLLIYLNSDLILGIFTDDPFIHKLGKQIIFIEFFLEIGRSVNIVMTRCLIAVGDVQIPVIVGIISAWSVGVGLGYILGIKLGYGLIGIWIAMAIDECIRAAIFIFRFKSEAWKKKNFVNKSA